MAAIRVYLDSSDYSVLSDPKPTDHSVPALLSDLRRWIAEGAIECVFSGTLLSEMAPLESCYTDASQRRADLLVELCGQHAVVSQDILFVGELKHALGLSEMPPTVHSERAEWHPAGVAEISPVGQIDFASNIRETIKGLGLNRQQRRAVESRALKAGQVRALLKTAVVANARQGSLDEVLSKYPMRPEDARVISRYAVGDATAAEASEAFLASLRDPRWMMRWFEQHHEQLTPFIKWTRAPAVSMLAIVNDMSEHAATVRATDGLLGTSMADELFSATQWLRWQDELVEKVARRMAKEFLELGSPQLSASLIDETCPGLSGGIRSLHSAWRSSTQKSPRKPEPSDFPDCLHAMYAPYVDVFRADSFMAPYIQKAVARRGTLVVQKLHSLGSRIRAVLAERGDA